MALTKFTADMIANVANFFNAIKQAATTTATGVVELATNAETQTGTDTDRAVTPAGLASLTATETRSGLVELATTAEATTGTDTQRAVTPAGLAAALAGTSAYNPRTLTVTSGSSINLANVEVVAFNNASNMTVSSFTNAVIGKLYTFRAVGAGSVTIDRTSAYLHGSANQVMNSNDTILMVGRSATTMAQGAPMADNG